MCGEDVVGLASENEVERCAHRLAHDPSHLLVPIVHRPATVREPAAVVLSRSARGLHDPVEGQEGAHDQSSHLSCSFLSFPSYTTTTNGPPPNRQRTQSLFQISSILIRRRPIQYRTDGRHYPLRSKDTRGWWVGNLFVNGRFSPNHAMTPSPSEALPRWCGDG